MVIILLLRHIPYSPPLGSPAHERSSGWLRQSSRTSNQHRYQSRKLLTWRVAFGPQAADHPPTYGGGTQWMTLEWIRLGTPNPLFVPVGAIPHSDTIRWGISLITSLQGISSTEQLVHGPLSIFTHPSLPSLLPLYPCLFIYLLPLPPKYIWRPIPPIHSVNQLCAGQYPFAWQVTFPPSIGESSFIRQHSRAGLSAVADIC